MSTYSACLAVLGHPLAITLIVGYVVRMIVFLVAAIMAIRTADGNRREACLKIVEMTCRRWPGRIRQLGHQSDGVNAVVQGQQRGHCGPRPAAMSSSSKAEGRRFDSAPDHSLRPAKNAVSPALTG